MQKHVGGLFKKFSLSVLLSLCLYFSQFQPFSLQSPVEMKNTKNAAIQQFISKPQLLKL